VLRIKRLAAENGAPLPRFSVDPDKPRTCCRGRGWS
jgi:hypothetical protein